MRISSSAWSRDLLDTGLRRYRSTPMSIARWAQAKSSQPETTTIFISGNSRLTSSLRARPSMKGIRISVMSTSGFVWRIRGRAISPSPASPARA